LALRATLRGSFSRPYHESVCVIVIINFKWSISYDILLLLGVDLIELAVDVIELVEDAIELVEDVIELVEDAIELVEAEVDVIVVVVDGVEVESIEAVEADVTDFLEHLSCSYVTGKNKLLSLGYTFDNKILWEDD
jgi:hypothetical protein